MTDQPQINHPDTAYFIAIRDDYLLLCQDAPDMTCAAVILDRLERWCEFKRNNGHEEWVFMTIAQWQIELRNQWGRNKVIKCLHWLVEQGFVSRRSNPDNTWDKTLQYQLNYREVNTVLSIVWDENIQSTEPITVREVKADTFNDTKPDNVSVPTSDSQESQTNLAIPKSPSKNTNIETNKDKSITAPAPAHEATHPPERDRLFDGIALFSFDIDIKAKKTIPQKTAQRIGQIKKWLLEIEPDIDAKRLHDFYQWWKDKYPEAHPPGAFEKFKKHFDIYRKELPPLVISKGHWRPPSTGPHKKFGEKIEVVKSSDLDKSA